MTCVVVNDASCLIDLKKGELLHVLLRLPYRFIVPLPIREEELLDFTAQEWRMLEDGGLATYDLPGEEVARVFALKREHSRLSATTFYARSPPLARCAFMASSGSSTSCTPPKPAMSGFLSPPCKSGGRMRRSSYPPPRSTSGCAVSGHNLNKVEMAGPCPRRSERKIERSCKPAPFFGVKKHRL